MEDNTDKNDLSKVSKSLKQPLITTGNFVDDFEKLRKFFKVDNAFVCNSGTSVFT